jgi:alanyl-tRNA synthetase
VAARVEQLVNERRELDKRLKDALRGGGAQGGGQVHDLVSAAMSVDGTRVVSARVDAPDLAALQTLGDALRERLGSGIGALAASFEDGKHTLLVVATDDLRDRGVRADIIVREVAAAAGGRGGGKPHMAQAGFPDAVRVTTALDSVLPTVRRLLSPGASGT